MLDDPELNELFRTESEEHLRLLEEGLLRLEVSPGDAATLEAVFRAAHTLKGAARMLGVQGIETIAHRFEDELESARQGKCVLSPDRIDCLCFALDAIRKLVAEAVTGEPAAVAVLQALV